MSFQSSFSALGASIGASIFGLVNLGKKKSEKPEDAELKEAKTEYYKQKTESAKLNDKYTKEATKFRKQRAAYQKIQNEYKQLKVDELKAKIENQKSQANTKAFKAAATSSMQAVAKRLENQNLVKQNLNNISSEQSPFIQTDGTTTNILSSEDIKALEAKQQREWRIHENRSNAAKKVWEVKSSIRNLEDVDAQWEFSGDFKAEDLKKIGLNKTKLREMDKGGEFEKAQDALAEHFKGTEIEAAILGAQNHAELGKIIENAIYRTAARKAEEEEYYDRLIAEAENPVEAIQNKQEVKNETYSVWPKRNYNLNTEDNKDFSETRNWRQ